MVDDVQSDPVSRHIGTFRLISQRAMKARPPT